MIRIFDLLISFLGLIILSPFLIFFFLILKYETKHPFFIQKRVGKNMKPFFLIKFRTMKEDTISIATHLTDKNSITKIGLFLRKYKIDELPQLLNVFKGDMSLVGPRPCLYNQYDLIKFREELNVFSVRPGITGLAQIKNIDMSQPKFLSEIDSKMINEFNLYIYFKLIFITILNII